MKKAVLCIALVVAFAAMLCGISYSAKEECGPCTNFTKCIGEAFTFDASKSVVQGGCALTYTWDFGDGTTGDGCVVTHCYEKPGDYTVRLSVTDSSGLPCSSDGITQVVKVNAPPTAVFNGPECACCGQEVTFDASASSSPTSKTLSYTWDFGDGTTGEGQVVKHTFTSGGVHKVKLLVDDGSCSACCKDTACLDVRVNTPPCADAGADVCMTCIPANEKYEVCFSGSASDPDGDSLTYMWNFGDGTSAEGQRVSHVYEKSGTYKATLMVDDGCSSACSTASDVVTVTLSRQPCADAGGDQKVCAGSAVQFDGSKSITEGGASYAWDFGDGQTGTGASVSHTYAQGGHYTATLTVTENDCTACDTVCVSVNQGPTAAISGPDRGCAGDNLTFDACGTSDPDGDCVTYMWDFGDGTTLENGPKVCHIFEKSGTYTVKVTVDDGSGLPCSMDSKSMQVTINARPTAVIGPCDACCVGKEILWDGSGSSDPDGDSLKYSWDFGDGTTAEGAKPTHVYKAAGCYNVTLTVDDGKGSACSVSTACQTANIHEGPKADLCVR